MVNLWKGMLAEVNIILNGALSPGAMSEGSVNVKSVATTPLPYCKMFQQLLRISKPLRLCKKR